MAEPFQPIPPRTERVATQIVDAAYHVHIELGPGLLESIYEESLAYEFAERMLEFKRQLAQPVVYKRLKLDGGFRLDFLVENAVVVEVKSVETVLPIHRAQVLTYMRLSGARLGYLINFNVAQFRHGIRRYVL